MKQDLTNTKAIVVLTIKMVSVITTGRLKMKLRLEQYGKVISLEIDDSSDIFEVSKLFKVVLKFFGFHNNSIDSVIKGEDDQ